MSTLELEQVIRDYILELYHKKYIGKIKVIKLNPIGYSIKLGMDVEYQPITIYAELEDCKFLKFLREELKNRRFNLLSYGRALLYEPYNCEPINSKCSCHDER